MTAQNKEQIGPPLEAQLEKLSELKPDLLDTLGYRNWQDPIPTLEGSGPRISKLYTNFRSQTAMTLLPKTA